tara:strand:+ start:2811 stop:2960 length:150 start_codon:yes stop_codon:yes gene_type:complete
MDSDLLIPIFWTFVFGALIALGVRKLTKKIPTTKKWVRPEIKEEKAEEK